MNCKKIIKVVHHSVIYVVQLPQCCPRCRRHLDLVDLDLLFRVLAANLRGGGGRGHRCWSS